MTVIKRGVTPDGIKIQIEDWSKDYDCHNESDTLAGYPIAKKTLNNPLQYPELYRPFRVSFNLGNSEKAERAFNALLNGEKTLNDFKEYMDDPKYSDCM